MQIIYILILSVFFLSCNAQKINKSYNDDELEIVQEVIKIQKLKKAKLTETSLNKQLFDELTNKIIFQEGEYHEFGELRNVFSSSVIDEVFNEPEIKNLKDQLDKDFKRVWKKITPKSYSEGLDLNLSKPVFTFNGNYAIIMYSYGNKIYHIGGSGVMLFEKKQGAWVYVSEFWGTMN